MTAIILQAGGLTADSMFVVSPRGHFRTSYVEIKDKIRVSQQRTFAYAVVGTAPLAETHEFLMAYFANKLGEIHREGGLQRSFDIDIEVARALTKNDAMLCQDTNIYLITKTASWFMSGRVDDAPDGNEKGVFVYFMSLADPTVNYVTSSDEPVISLALAAGISPREAIKYSAATTAWIREPIMSVGPDDLVDF